ncbi:MAG: amidohydrolase family protein [Planctomycetota bacterium]|nr:amidohydrolase family protein [Planctomycetota bacterium]MDA1249819.1 amidohydrolase family protein [Planctomycetota bacterium]
MKLTRRDILKSAAVSLAGAAASIPVLPGLFADEKPARKASKYIDVHTHIGTTWNGNKELTAEGLLLWMDEHDIEKSVLLPLTSPESSSFLLLTEPALKAAKDHPDRFIPFCSVDPRTSLRGGRKGFLEVIGRYVDMGAKGFGEHKVGLNFDDPLMMQIYDVCEELKIPLLFHMDNERGKDQPGLPRLEHALATYPKLKFIGHGPGWWASISGGLTQEELASYPKGKVRPDGAIDRLMEKYPNIYGDLSAGSGANSISRDAEFGRAFMIRRQDRLMFGTDYLQPGQAVPQFEVFDGLDLPKEVAGKIFRGNAEKVLALKS